MKNFNIFKRKLFASGALGNQSERQYIKAMKSVSSVLLSSEVKDDELDFVLAFSDLLLGDVLSVF